MKPKDIVEFIEKDFGIQVTERGDYYTMPTVCHNLDHVGASHKLYLYKNEDTQTPIFYCYTGCGEAFNIYQLVQKYAELRGQKLTYGDAYKRVHGHAFSFSEVEKSEPVFKKKVEFENPLEVRLPEYPEGILDIFSKNKYTHPWALEGIDFDALEKYEVAYSSSYEGVVIPHRDWRGNLVGVRLRTYNPEKAKNYKYMPMLVNNIYYRHPISLNFFGLFQNQGNIRRAKKVILVESEKAVLQADSMLDGDNITLAVCGSTISSWQINLLTYYLEVDEVIIAFDKEYEDYDGAFEYFKKIASQVKSLVNFASVRILLDTEGVFSLKDSPFDRTAKDYRSLKGWPVE